LLERDTSVQNLTLFRQNRLFPINDHQKNKINIIKGASRPLRSRGLLGSGVKQHGRRDCGKIVFGTNDIQMAVIVFVKFVEFVAAFSGHEFHELTRIKFPTTSEEFTAA